MKIKHYGVLWAMTVGPCLMLTYIRGKIIGIHALQALDSPKDLWYLFASSRYDLIFGLSVLLVFLFLLKFAGSRRHQIGVIWTYGIVLMLTLLYAFSNRYMIKMLGVPFNYQWLYYSDFLDNNESKLAAENNLNIRFWYKFFQIIMVAVVVSYVGQKVFRRYTFQRFYQHLVMVLSLIFSLGIFHFFYHDPFRYALVANPIVAFAKSWIDSFMSQPYLFSASLPDTLSPLPIYQNINKGVYQPTSDPGIENVLVIVMESVPAQYVAGYQPQYDVTPMITRHLSDAVVFSDIYAHSPSTNNTMVSWMNSLYPMMSYKSLSSEYPEMQWPSISSELGSHGFKTGFFFGSDTRFKKMDQFLNHRGFDVVADYRNIPCRTNKLTTEWENLDGVDENCTAKALFEWIEQQSPEKPFFATYWTMQTHYPYFNTDQVLTSYTQDSLFNIYLNALHYTDEVIGHIFDYLEATHLAESTLVVLMGDHGEAFLQHFQYGHASHIYEENVKTPLIFVNPTLFHGETRKVVGGHIDIGPTIMEILQLKTPPQWQGVSLFNPNRANTAYFFSPWSDYQFGIRDDQYKMIYNATTGHTQLYDLNQDPAEKENLAGQFPHKIKSYYLKLAQWVQYQERLVKEQFGQKG